MVGLTRRGVAIGACVALLAAAGVGVVAFRLVQQLATGAGVAAKQLCALRFVSGLDLERARALYLEDLLRDGDSMLRVEVDPEREAVTASMLGIASQVAVHRPGYGCTLVQDRSAGLETMDRAGARSPEMRVDREHREAAFDVSALEAAVSRAFQGGPERPPLNTLAVVVLHGGRLVAERYAEGIEARTRLPGWSMTKSVTATLVGVLVEQGLLDVHAPGAIRAWRGTDDPRSRISLDHLLRMTSGLLLTEGGETGGGLDPTSRMLYREADAARYAASRPLRWEVGSHFEYMSGNTVLAMRAVQDAIGGDLRDARDFIHENLFDPLHMHGAVLEPDQAGTFLGSTHMLASARDWARLGQLYLDGGMARDRRVIPQDWIEYVTAPTRPSLSERRGDVFWERGRSAYGAGFWLFSDGSEAGGGEASALPRDAFDANGFQGQYLHIIPSRELVVVRLGATSYRGHDHERLPREIIAAVRRS